MARPTPHIILEWQDPDSYGALQICEPEAQCYFAVLYKDKPFQLRKVANTEVVGTGNFKYPKTVFANSGHAINLAERLNKLFNTSDFTVHKMANGYQVNQ